MAIGAFVEVPGGAGGEGYSGRVTPFVVLTCVVAGSGGILFGYDLGISGSAISSPPPYRVKPSLHCIEIEKQKKVTATF
jgi:hypothetical protein